MKTLYDKDMQEKIASYITGLFQQVPRPELLYHNLAHTQHVVKRTEEISTNCSLSEKETFMVIAAAWFHDCGHLFGPGPQHEERSVVVMRAFLATAGFEDDTLQSIEQCILDTRFPYEPKSLLAEVLCDADSYHLGTPEFVQTDELVKKEFELQHGFIPFDWDKMTMALLERHTFFTAYCRTLLNDGKQKNIDLVRSKLNNKE